MKKKVLIFSTAYFPFIGGAEVAVKEITDRINDIQFDLITARMNRKLPTFERIGNVNVYRMGFGRKTLDKIILLKFGFLKALWLNKKNNYDFAWSIMASQASIAASLFKIINNSTIKLLSLLRRGGGEVGLLHATSPDPSLARRGTIKPCHFKKIRLVLTLQEGDEEEHLARYVFGNKFLYKILIRPWHLLVFKKADKITAISNYLRDRAQNNGVKIPVEIIPNGVDIEKFANIDLRPGRDELRRQLNIQPEDTILISTSRLVAKNGLEDLVDATKKLVDEGHKVKTIILGDGPLKDQLKKQIEEYQPEGAMLKESQIGKQQTIVLFGNKPQENIAVHLHMADIFIRPSLSEGLGNSFLEAMVVGLPVIATPVGGIPDFLKDGETGWFCGVKNPESIAEKVKYILDGKNKAEVARVKENAKKMVEEKYNWEKIAIKMKNIFIY